LARSEKSGRAFLFLPFQAARAMCRGILYPMRTLYNEIAMRIKVGYVVVIVVLLIISNVRSDSEGRIFDYLVIGFPWILALMNSSSIWDPALFVILNSLTVYLLALIFVESFEDADRNRTRGMNSGR
jgi:hypothetical protein